MNNQMPVTDHRYRQPVQAGRGELCLDLRGFERGQQGVIEIPAQNLGFTRRVCLYELPGSRMSLRPEQVHDIDLGACTSIPADGLPQHLRCVSPG